MDFRIRDARAADKETIAAFTQDTFDWGDYVEAAFDRWLAEPDGKLVVAVDDDDRPVAMGRGAMLSSTELWLQGARVHPEWRRRGIASAIDDTIEAWALGYNAQVSRLAVEDWNTPARRQVERIGMRTIGTWVVAERRLSTDSPTPETNGGRRPPPRDRLTAAVSAEAAPAYMAWSVGALGKAARQLLAIGWTWRRLTIDDLIRAAQAAAFWMSPAGWVMAAVDGETLDVGWLETAPDEVGDLCRATIDLAVELGTTRINIRVPDVDWLTRTLENHGFEITKVVLYAKAL
jgi:GNAT superfamily N-acetyltransferase